MLDLIVKAALSGVIVAAIFELIRRFPGFGGLLASLPLSLAIYWLYRDTNDPERVTKLAGSTLWFVLPLLLMLVAFPVPVRQATPFGVALAANIIGTLLLYASFLWAAPRLGMKL